jgi:6-phosphogluconolactonase
MFTRRDFCRVTGTLAAPALLPKLLLADAAPAAPAAAAAAEVAAAEAAPPALAYAYVGTYTPNGGGIYLFSVDLGSGVMTQQQVVDDIRNPTWLAVNAAMTRLYAVSEIDSYLDTHSGAVVAYSIEPQTQQLKRIGAVSSGGAAPTYLSIHPSEKFLLVGNYGSGSVAVIPLDADGALGEAVDIRPSVGAHHHARATDDPPGQFANSDHDSAHVHMVAPDPSGQFVIANDSGLDLTLIWRLDMQTGRLLPAEVPVLMAPSGSAPRHFAFHPNGRFMYNLYEHDAKVAVYDYDAAHGAFKLKQLAASLPPKFAGSNLSAEIVVSPNGKFLYVSNRLHNAIAVFGVAADGQLRNISDTWVHADSPRNITFDPRGELLFACNQKGDSITSFRVNAATGALTFTGHFEPVGSPCMMTFLKMG